MPLIILCIISRQIGGHNGIQISFVHIFVPVCTAFVQNYLTGHAIFFTPVFKKLYLYTAFINSYADTIETGRIRCHNIRPVFAYKQIIVLLALLLTSVVYFFRTLLRIGDVAHNVYFSILQHLHKITETSIDILVFPACIICNLLQIIITVPRLMPVSFSFLVAFIDQISYTNRLQVVIFLCTHGQDTYHQAQCHSKPDSFYIFPHLRSSLHVSYAF